MKFLRYMSVLLLVGFMSACASLSPSYEKPQLNITSFSLAPQSNGLAPRFIIGLQVIHPNRDRLSLKGMSYSVEVENNRILSGATADLPEVAGYGMADFTIQASPDLLGGARLINQLLNGPTNSLNYTFKAKLDAGSLIPFIHLEERGNLSLSEN